MQCLKPMAVVRNGHDLTIPCGKCIRCRIKKREEWAGRILLESLSHPVSWFVTLTYSTPNLVYGCLPGLDPVPTLWKRDHTLFMKRLRKRLSRHRIRYFCVGEYGFEKARPHFHYVLYGLDQDITADVAASWERGFVTCDVLTPERARYCAGYTVEKLTGPLAFADGRCPEFATMSRRPGLGNSAALMIGRQLMQRRGSAIGTPTSVKIGDRSVLLDRYARKLIDSVLGQVEKRDEIRLFRAHEATPSIKAELRQAWLDNPFLDEVEEQRYQERKKQRRINRFSKSIPSSRLHSGCQ